MFGVSETHFNTRDLVLLGKLASTPTENNLGLTGRLSQNLQI